MKRLYRSTANKMLCGVCGGIGEYFKVDPTIIRLVAVIAACCTLGWVLLAYIIAAVIIPKNPAEQ